MSHIIELQSLNVKRLRAVRIRPTSAVTVISGKNGQGKSSVLDSILYALAGTSVLPPMPIRDNGDSAETTLTLSDGLVIKRTYAPSGSQLKITAADGSPVKSPQALLDSLTGKTSFDPLAFMNQDPKTQAATLRAVLGLDFTEQDAERKRLYDERTVVNRRLTEMRGAVAALPYYPDAPAAEVVSTQVLKQIEAAQAHNGKLTTLTAAQISAQATVTRAEESVKRTVALIAALEKQLAEARAQLVKDTGVRDAADKAAVQAEAAVTAFQPIDTTELKAKLAAAEDTNRKVRANAARAKAITEGQAKKAESDALTAAIDAIDTAKAEALAAVEFPVEDLSFENDIVTYQNLPFSQACSSAKLKVSVAIGAALNPGLKVMLIREGNWLDEDNMQVLRQMAEELGVQVWLERVSTDQESAIIIEDGSVKGDVIEQDAAPTPTKKRAAKPKGAVSTPAVEHSIPEGALF